MFSSRAPYNNSQSYELTRNPVYVVEEEWIDSQLTSIHVRRTYVAAVLRLRFLKSSVVVVALVWFCALY